VQLQLSLWTRGVSLLHSKRRNDKRPLFATIKGRVLSQTVFTCSCNYILAYGYHSSARSFPLPRRSTRLSCVYHRKIRTFLSGTDKVDQTWYTGNVGARYAERLDMSAMTSLNKGSVVKGPDRNKAELQEVVFIIVEEVLGLSQSYQ